MKIFVVTSNNGVRGRDEFRKLIKDSELVGDMTKADLVIFTGGADISPSLYGGINNHFIGYTDLARDIVEVAAFKAATKRGIPIFGVCRGAQLACVLSGNELFVHVSNHGGSNHEIKLLNSIRINDKLTKKISISSDHHQMMRLTGNSNDYTILGYAHTEFVRKSISDIFVDKHGHYINVFPAFEPEIVHFKNTKSLAMQPHPEWELDNEEVVNFTNDLIVKTLFTN